MEKKDVQVIKKKPRGGNSPVIGDNGLMVEPGDNAKFLQKNMVLMKLPKLDKKNLEAVEERIQWYFDFMIASDSKPTVSGFAMALDMDRRSLWAIVNDQPANGKGYKIELPPAVSDSIKKGYRIMENLWEEYMQNGKINPVSGIFLGKNNYGYMDKTEYVLTPNHQNDSDYDPDSIRQRYLIDSADEKSES